MERKEAIFRAILTASQAINDEMHPEDFERELKEALEDEKGETFIRTLDEELKTHGFIIVKDPPEIDV